MLRRKGATLSKRKIQIEKELECNGSVNIPYEVVKATLSDFRRLPKVTRNTGRKSFASIKNR